MNLSMALQSFISTTVILFASGVIRSEQRVSPLYLSMNARARMTRARGRRSCVDEYGLFHGTQIGFRMSLTVDFDTLADEAFTQEGAAHGAQGGTARVVGCDTLVIGW